MPPEYTDDELANLSAEEAAALKEDDDALEAPAEDEDGAEDAEPVDQQQDDKSDDDGDSEQESDDDKASDDDKDAEAEQAADGDQDADTEEKSEEKDAPKDDLKDPFVPRYQLQDNVEMPEEVQNQIKELGQKVEDGEISPQDYLRQCTELERPFMIAQAKKEMFEEINKQNAAQAWEQQQKEFFELYPDYRESAVKFGALDAALNHLYAQEEHASNSGAWFLREAKRMVDAELGGAKENPPADPPKPSKKPDLPQNLASVPAADREGTGDQYSALDKLDGIELEMALANLSESDLDKYLRTH